MKKSSKAIRIFAGLSTMALSFVCIQPSTPINAVSTDTIGEGYVLAEGMTLQGVLAGERSIVPYTYDLGRGSVKIENGTKANTIKVTSKITAGNTTGIVQDNITKSTTLTLTGTDATNDYNVVINKVKGVNLTLRGVNLEPVSGGISPVILQAGAEVSFRLEGENTLAAATKLSDRSTGKAAGLTVPEGTKITIAGKGSLLAKGSVFGAGIGGGYKETSGTIEINGGTVKTEADVYGAGIGGGFEGASGTITITGGKVEAMADVYGAGIGGGYKGVGGTIKISGGMVKAKSVTHGAGIGGGYEAAGGDISISGGRIEATAGETGAGIGGGNNEAGGNISISGGTVEATAGKTGAGIGGGNEGDSGTIKITGGTLKAEGQRVGTLAFLGAGIGGGAGGDCNTIHISGGMIKAKGDFMGSTYFGSAIGGGAGGRGGTICISGGMVEAIAGESAAGIIGGGMHSSVKGTFTTSCSASDIGNAFIRVAIIRDNSYLNPSSGTQGVIFEGNTGTVYGSPTLQANAEIKADDVLTIAAGNNFSIGSGITLTNSGTIINGGAITNKGTIMNNETITNDGTITNKGTIMNKGTITNNVTIMNDESIVNKGTIMNNGTLTNKGELYLALEGVITTGNNGDLTGAGRYTIALRSEDITIIDEANITYTGSQIKPKYKIKESRPIGTKDFKIAIDHYVVSYAENIKPGEGKIIFTDKKDNTITIEKSFTIHKKNTKPSKDPIAPTKPTNPTTPNTGDEIGGSYILWTAWSGALLVMIICCRKRAIKD